MKAKKPEEKRRSERICLLLQVFYKTPKAAGFKKATACHDVSGGGVRILIDEPLELKTQMNVRLKCEDWEKPIDSLCKVIWCLPASGGRFTAGLQFIRIDEEVLFIKYICEKMLDFYL